MKGTRHACKYSVFFCLRNVCSHFGGYHLPCAKLLCEITRTSQLELLLIIIHTIFLNGRLLVLLVL